MADGTMIAAPEHLRPGLTIGDPRRRRRKDGFLIGDVREPDRPLAQLGQVLAGLVPSRFGALPTAAAA